MKLRLHEIAVPYDEDSPNALRRILAKRLGPLFEKVEKMAVARRSIDARQRPVKILYSLDVSFNPGNDDISVPGAVKPPKMAKLEVQLGNKPLSSRPVIIGGGPAGLFAALLLAEHGLRPLLLERGGGVQKRVDKNHQFFSTRNEDPECNILFGLGGAGTFSDGKLTTGLRHRWLPPVLGILEECGAPKKILFDAKPHIGTDVLVRVVENLAERIENAGGTIKTDTRVDEIKTKRGALESVRAGGEQIDAEVAVLAIGHSARDTMQMLSFAGIEITPKPFQIGVRVEHPQPWLDKVRFGEAAGHKALGAADYKLTAKSAGTPVFSFCMCPGGQTIPTINETGCLALNGMSLSARNSAFASSGLVVTLRPEGFGGTDLHSCLAFQRNIERACFEAGGSDYTAPGQKLVDFAQDKITKGSLPPSSYKLGVVPARLSKILPSQIAIPIQNSLAQFNRRLRGYLHPEAVILAPESRASSPLRIVRDPSTLETPTVSGLYPVGEGAGYAGGIMSSALDGLDAAAKIIEQYSS